MRVCKDGPARSLRGGDWSPAISVVANLRFAVFLMVQRHSSLRHRPPDHRPAPQPAWKTWRADEAESSPGTCDTHGPQAVSSSRLEAARIGRPFGEGQPLMGQERQPSLPKGRSSYFTLVLRAQSLQGSSEALPRCWTELDGISRTRRSRIAFSVLGLSPTLAALPTDPTPERRPRPGGGRRAGLVIRERGGRPGQR